MGTRMTRLSLNLGSTAPPGSKPGPIVSTLTGYRGVGESGIFAVSGPTFNRPNYYDVEPKWVNPGSGETSLQEFFISQDTRGQFHLGITGESIFCGTLSVFFS
jgi:hypothetical protein